MAKDIHLQMRFFFYICGKNSIEINLLTYRVDQHTANIFDVIFTVFKCVPISTVISLYRLHLIAAPSIVE